MDELIYIKYIHHNITKNNDIFFIYRNIYIYFIEISKCLKFYINLSLYYFELYFTIKNNTNFYKFYQYFKIK